MAVFRKKNVLNSVTQEKLRFLEKVSLTTNLYHSSEPCSGMTQNT